MQSIFSRNISALSAAGLCLAVASSLHAQVAVDTSGNGNDSSRTITVSNAFGNPSVTGDQFVSGGGTFSDSGSENSFSFTVQAVSDWGTDNSDLTNSNFGSWYTSSADFVTIDNGASMMGVDSLPGDGLADNTINMQGEALVIEFDTSGLATSTLELSGLIFGNSGNADDIDLFLYDSDGSTFLLSETFQGNGVPSISATIGDGDVLLIGTRDTTETSFRVSGLTLDIVAVPEPSTYALVAGVLVGFLALRRRRA
ncbi:MAG: PEP-CTERM sorting domain-containing protein [Opitutales bacterium]